MSKKKKIIIIIIAAVLVAGGIATAAFFVFGNKETNENQNAKMPQISNNGNYVTATGTTATGMITEELKLDFLETQLMVEEVYIHQGDTVVENTPVFKLTEDSYADALKELERAVESSNYDYKNKLISSAESKIDAQATYEKSLVNKQYAQNTYEETVRKSKETVDELEKKISEQQELIDEYTAAITTNYYYTYYEVEKKKEILTKNFSYLMELYDEWDIGNMKSTGNNSGTQSQQNSSNGPTMPTDRTNMTDDFEVDNDEAPPQQGQAPSGQAPSGQMPDDGGSNSNSDSKTGTQPSGNGSTGTSSFSNGNDKLTAYNLFDEEVSEEEEEYEEALKNYEDKTRMAPANLEQAKANMTQLEAELSEAKADYQATVISAKLTLNQTLAECEQAKNTYETELKRIQDELDSYVDDNDEAAENLEYFNSKIKDGCFLTSSAGEVRAVMVSNDSKLSGTSFVMAYTDVNSLSVEVSVDQADIALLYVGMDAKVMISGYDTYEGKVVKINPVTQSGNRSSVYYTVTVTLDGDISKLTQNLTSTVMFDIGDTSTKEENNVKESMDQTENE